RVLVAESALSVDVISHSLGDAAALAEAGASKEEIMNAFGVPLAMFTSVTNLANLQASIQYHTKFTISPRLKRRDEKLNEQLIPRYDPTGRLFVSSGSPVPEDREFKLHQDRDDLVHGVRTINEVRKDRGLPPVPWGNVPFPTLGPEPKQPSNPNEGVMT